MSLRRRIGFRDHLAQRGALMAFFDQSIGLRHTFTNFGTVATRFGAQHQQVLVRGRFAVDIFGVGAAGRDTLAQPMRLRFIQRHRFISQQIVAKLPAPFATDKAVLNGLTNCSIAFP